MQNRQGFTLIELSIVLVIIGLVIGGVIAGKEMIELAKIRSEISQLDKFRMAEDLFKSKYGYIPGDIPTAKAAQFRLIRDNGGWGDPRNVNGNGYLNGRCFDAAAVNCAGSYNYFGWLFTESDMYFTQMSGGVACNGTMFGASLLNVELNVAAAHNCAVIEPAAPGATFPRSKINPQFGIIPVTANLFSLSTWYILNGSRSSFWLANFTSEPSLKPWQALQLDSKLDDGVPSSGSVRAYDIEVQIAGGVWADQYVVNDDVAGECIVDAAGSSYNLSRNEVLCHIIVKK